MSKGQKTKSKLKATSTSVVPDLEDNENQGSTIIYKCKSVGCEKQFGFSSHLKQHEKTHVKTQEKDQERREKVELTKIGEEREIYIIDSDSDSASDLDSRDDSQNNSVVSIEEESSGVLASVKNSIENQNQNQSMTTVTKKGGNFACHLCPATLKHKTTLGKHLREQHGDSTLYSCDQCSFQSRQNGNVKVHVMKVHSGLRPYKCPEPSCSYAAKTKDNLNSHLRSHSQSKDFKCTHPTCSYACNQASALRTHMCIHSDERPYPCKLCGHKTRSASALRNHMFTHTGEKSNVCPYPECDYACSESGTIKIHIRAIHTNERPYKCPHPGCEFSAAQKPNLNTHIKNWHSTTTDEKPFKCTLCDYAAKHKLNLERHVGHYHTRERLLEIKCEWEGCSYVAPSKAAIKSHQVVHTKERNYECDICHKKFGLSSTRHIHRRLHNDDKRYKCEVCGYRAVQRGNVQKHMITAHTGEEKLFKCQEKGCCYKGKTITHLRSHLKSHEKKRQFSCLVQNCGFSCTVWLSWRTHLKEHKEKGENQYQCSKCSYFGDGPKSLEKHQKKHDKKKKKKEQKSKRMEMSSIKNNQSSL